MENKKQLPKEGIANALGEFQNACPAISKEKTAKGTKFSYKYGSLPHILETIKPHMKKANLSFTQTMDLLVNVEGGETLKTTLFHSLSGETIESTMILPDFKFDQMNLMQSKGSVITYLRRYALMSILGIVTEEDDNDAQGSGKKNTKATSTPKVTKPKAADKPYLNPEPKDVWLKAVKFLADGGTIDEIKTKYRIGKNNEERLLNEALTFDDLPFDRRDAEDAEILSTETPEVKPNEPNKLFDEQGDLNPE